LHARDKSCGPLHKKRGRRWHGERGARKLPGKQKAGEILRGGRCLESTWQVCWSWTGAPAV
jgi:hypothetical protein